MKYLLSLLLLCSAVFFAGAQSVSLTNKEVNKLKKLVHDDARVQELYAGLKKQADQSLGEAPNPIDTVVSEGHLANDPKKVVTIKSLKDIDKAYSLAIAYSMEGNKDYRKKAIEFIAAWATVNQPQGNPINDSKFENLFFAYDLLKKKASKDQRRSIDAWLEKMADAEMATALPEKTTSFNNWNSHRLKVIGAIAYILNTPRHKAYIDERLPIQIQRNLLPDGRGFDLVERDAFHYHIYTLEPLISLATVLKRATNKDFYHYTSPGGASIEKSVNYLIPFVSGEKTHPEFVNSKVPFDRKRAENHEPGYETGALFHPATAYGVLIQAAYFEPSCLDVVKKKTNTVSDYYNWQSVINAVER